MAKDYKARKTGLVPVRLDLLPEDRERLRCVAHEEGRQMSEYARAAVLTAIEKSEKNRNGVDSVDTRE